VLQIVNRPTHTTAELARVIEADVALTAYILKVVNSVAYALVQKVESLERAVLVLGQNVVIGLAIGQSASLVFDRPLEGYEAERGEYWAHSLRTALAAREVAHYVRGGMNPSLAYTAGLLHDIGKFILSRFMAGAAPELLAQLGEGRTGDFLDAERERLGTDHSEAGAELAKLWRLPDSLIEAIRHHHRPAQAAPEHRALVYAVHLGDMAAMSAGAGTGADCMGYGLDAGYTEHVHMDADEFAELLIKVDADFNKLQAALFESQEERP
jgi:putative nucleotidyltransferase with HDIG domain